MIKKLLIFDIDGTLLLTGGAGKIAFERAVEELFSISDSWGQTMPHGKTDPMIIQEIFSAYSHIQLTEERYIELCNRYHFHFAAEITRASKFELMPGIKLLLDALFLCRELGLGIATGNFEEAALLKLRRGALEHYFSFGGYGSDAADRAELTRIAYERGRKLLGTDVSPKDTFVIGDTIFDIRAGKQLGAKTIGVATGNAPIKVLKEAGADYVFADLSDMQSFLSLIGVRPGTAAV